MSSPTHRMAFDLLHSNTTQSFSSIDKSLDTRFPMEWKQLPTNDFEGSSSRQIWIDKNNEIKGSINQTNWTSTKEAQSEGSKTIDRVVEIFLHYLKYPPRTFLPDKKREPVVQGE